MLFKAGPTGVFGWFSGWWDRAPGLPCPAQVIIIPYHVQKYWFGELVKIYFGAYYLIILNSKN